MRRWVLLLLMGATVALFAQAKCDFGSPEAADSLVKALNAEKTCKSASALMSNCRWGSSADANFAPIVVEKCEGEFFNRLSPAGRDNYETQMQLCAYEYARQQGTISISNAAMCQVDVANHFAANPAAFDAEPAKASFDCSQAHSLLERAICSDIRLGHADIVLAEVYKGTLKWEHPQNKLLLVNSERKWLQTLPSKCGITAIPIDEKQVSCLRDQIEIRFSLLDGCGNGGDFDTSCAAYMDNPESLESIDPVEELPRASFDCESPKTALQIVICADSDLGQKDIRLANVYKAATAQAESTTQKAMVESEQKWLTFVGSSCPLGAVGGIPPVLARACVRSAFQVRIDQLNTCMQEPADNQISCINKFHLIEK